jgi:hypothetical protein
MAKIEQQIKMKYCVVRFMATKPDNYEGGELDGEPSILYKRHLKSEAKSVLKQVLCHAREKGLKITNESKGSYFICENNTTKYMFAIMDYKENMRIASVRF